MACHLDLDLLPGYMNTKRSYLIYLPTDVIFQVVSGGEDLSLNVTF